VINISSSLGSIGRNGSGIATYSSSKTALDMFTNRLANPLKLDGIIAIVMDPGWVKTDMGGSSAELTPTESVSGMINVIDQLDLKDSGRYYRYNREELPW
jgi:NAD(P)-dependent dehydrogenase (short-subunit alcohol dehydrogenase family)